MSILWCTVRKTSNSTMGCSASKKKITLLLGV